MRHYGAFLVLKAVAGTAATVDPPIFLAKTRAWRFAAELARTLLSISIIVRLPGTGPLSVSRFRIFKPLPEDMQ
jgi:hypothetical protein